MRASRVARAERNISNEAAEGTERRRQTRGLVWLALAAVGFAIARAVALGGGGVRSVFGPR